MKKLRPFMAYCGHEGPEEGACLVFAHDNREARKTSWPWVQGWFDCDYIDIRAHLIKDGGHLYAEADQDKLQADVAHVVDNPKTCSECGRWGEVRGDNTKCDSCLDYEAM